MAKLECPAAPPGFRDAGNNKGYGTLYSVGTSGFNWSSTRTDTSAHYLYFSSPWLNPEGNSSRAHGFLLRCLQEKGTNRIGSADRRNFAKKSPAFACRAAPEPAVGRRLARATLRVAVVQLDARLQTINRESSARRPPTDRTAARKPRSTIARPSAAPCGGHNFVAAPPATGPSPKKNLARRSLSTRQRNLVQTRTLRLNDFAT